VNRRLQDIASDLGHGRAAAEIVADAIRHLIVAGNLRPGDRLPPERELAGTLGAARVTVRSAIRTLNTEGLLLTARGRSGGTFVQKSAVRDSARRTSVAAFKQQLAESYEFRRILEPVAAELAAERGSTSERNALIQLCKEVGDGESRFQDLDTRFHLLIAKMARNRHILESIERNRGAFVNLVNSVFLSIDQPSDRHFGEAHLPIALAIGRGDGAAARREMATHFKLAHREFLEALLRVSSHSHDIRPGRSKGSGTGKRRRRD
jgi:GntR family transcriptional repressor for pyruvate dehydrogenase complex